MKWGWLIKFSLIKKIRRSKAMVNLKIIQQLKSAILLGIVKKGRILLVRIFFFWTAFYTLVGMTEISYAQYMGEPYSSGEKSQVGRYFESAKYYKATSVGVGMRAAEVSSQFNCPLFSNSPYSDLMQSLDGLASAIQLYPSCKENHSFQNSIESGKSLREKLIALKESISKDKGQVPSQAIEEFLSNSAQLQESLLAAVQSGQACYQNSDDRKILFKINDVVQNIAPMALDFVTKLPSFNSSYLPMVAGAGAVVQSITTLEKVLAESESLDVSSEERGAGNRLALIKNTCQFMKMYNKIQLLELNRAEQARKISANFTSKMKPVEKLRLRLKEFVNKSLEEVSQESKDVAGAKVRTNSLQQIFSNFGNEIGGGLSEEATCSAAKTFFRSLLDKGILENYRAVRMALVIDPNSELASNIKEADQKFAEFKNQVELIKQTLDDSESCAKLKKDFFDSVQFQLKTTEYLVNYYIKSKPQEQKFFDSVVDLSLKNADAKMISEEKKQIEKFAEISVFEPSEVTKKIRGMHSYLFDGPETNLSFLKRLNIPGLREAGNKKGPVFDFLQNNENQFESIMAEFDQNLRFIMKSEENYARAKVPRFSKQSDVINYYDRLKKSETRLLTLNLKNFPKGTEKHKAICGQMKMAIRNFQRAKEMLASSYFMCEMIDPVLDEQKISWSLKNYCRGEDGYKSRAIALEKENKFLIFDILIDRRSDLECD